MKTAAALVGSLSTLAAVAAMAMPGVIGVGGAADLVGRASVGAGPSTAGAATATTDRRVGPASFAGPGRNRYFPLEPGTVWRYRGRDAGERYLERVVVTDRTKRIQGVTTTVVRDVVRRADGTLAERTRDWYAADEDGTVWYFGERTATFDENGDLESREGSWRAGVDGAVAGIIMPADPRPTDAYRQELFRGHAEDQAWIVQRGAHTTVPYGHLRRVVRSFEWTRLEKGVLSLKLYAPHVGLVRERDMSGGAESFVLVSMRR